MFLFFLYFLVLTNTGAKYQTFLINLERRSDKFQSSKFQLDFLNISFNVFTAVDGGKLRNQLDQNKNASVAELVDIKNLKLKRETLEKSNNSLSHVGCWLSHLKLMQKIEDSKVEDNILILEDDFVADGDAVSLIASAINKLPFNWDLLYVGHCDTRGCCENYLDRKYDMCKCRKNQPIGCTHGYMLRNYSVASRIFERGNSEEPLLADLYYDKTTLNRFIVFPHIFSQRKSILADVKSEGGVFTELRNSTLKDLVEKYY